MHQSLDLAAVLVADIVLHTQRSALDRQVKAISFEGVRSEVHLAAEVADAKRRIVAHRRKNTGRECLDREPAGTRVHNVMNRSRTHRFQCAIIASSRQPATFEQNARAHPKTIAYIDRSFEIPFDDREEQRPAVPTPSCASIPANERIGRINPAPNITIATPPSM